eukprot:2653390-Pleurochrysis_carterae.AAC.1
MGSEVGRVGKVGGGGVGGVCDGAACNARQQVGGGGHHAGRFPPPRLLVLGEAALNFGLLGRSHHELRNKVTCARHSKYVVRACKAASSAREDDGDKHVRRTKCLQHL